MTEEAGTLNLTPEALAYREYVIEQLAAGKAVWVHDAWAARIPHEMIVWWPFKGSGMVRSSTVLP